MKTTNIYLTSFTVHFKPLPEFKVSPHWFLKQIAWLTSDEKISAEAASFLLFPLKVTAYVNSYLFSPNVAIPLQICEVIAAASIFNYTTPLNKVVSVVFSTLILGAVVKYTQDGTLHKLSDDFFTTATEAKEAIKKLESERFKEVTFHEGYKFTELGFVRWLMFYINKLFRCLFFCT